MTSIIHIKNEDFLDDLLINYLKKIIYDFIKVDDIASLVLSYIDTKIVFHCNILEKPRCYNCGKRHANPSCISRPKYLHYCEKCFYTYDISK